MLPRLLVLSLIVVLAALGFASPTAAPSEGCHVQTQVPAHDGHLDVATYALGCEHNPTAYEALTEVGTFTPNQTGTPCHGYTKVWLVFGWVKYSWYSEGCPHKPKPTPKPSQLAELLNGSTSFAAPPPFAAFARTLSSDALPRDLVLALREVGDDDHPYVPGDGPGPCFCLEITFIGHGEVHTVTYQICGMEDLQGVKSIVQIGQGMGLQMISRRVPCPH